MFKRFLFCLALLPGASQAEQHYFVMTEQDGTVHIAARPLTSQWRELRWAGEVISHAPRVARIAWREKLKPRIKALADEVGLAYELVDAMILAESGYDPDAVSVKGAVGLMQLMPDTAKRFGVSDRSDPDENLRGGVAYLKWLMKRYDRLELAIAAFNAGEGAVDRAGGVPNYPETKEYVDRVLSIIGQGL